MAVVSYVMGTSVGRGTDLVDPSIGEFHHRLLKATFACSDLEDAARRVAPAGGRTVRLPRRAGRAVAASTTGRRVEGAPRESDSDRRQEEARRGRLAPAQVAANAGGHS